MLLQLRSPARYVTCAAMPPHIPGYHICWCFFRYLHGQIWNENQEGLRQERMGSYDSRVKLPVRERTGLSFRRHHPRVIGEVESDSSDCFHHCLGNLSFTVLKHQEATAALTAKLGSTTATPFPPVTSGCLLAPPTQLFKVFLQQTLLEPGLGVSHFRLLQTRRRASLKEPRGTWAVAAALPSSLQGYLLAAPRPTA